MFLDLNESEATEIIQMLFNLHPRYSDYQSRNAVQDTFLVYFKSTHGSLSLKTFAKLAAGVAASKKALALSDLQTVFDWTNSAIASQSSVFDSDKEVFKSLILTQAFVLHKVITFEKIDKHLRSYNSSVRAVRNTWTTALRSKNEKARDLAEFSLSVLLEKPTNITDYTIRLISVAAIAGSSVDLLSANTTIQTIVEDKKDEIFKAYIQGVVATKVQLSRHLTDSYAPLFVDFTSQKDFDSILAPAIANAIRRAPEIILSTISLSLFSNLSPLLDTADALNTTLLPPLLNAFTSSKIPVREYACENLQALLKLSQPTQKLDQVIESIVTPLKTNKVTSADHRVFYGSSLSAIKPYPSGSKYIYTGLVNSVGKEINEAALRSLSKAFFKHLYFDLQNDTPIDKSANDVIIKGVTEKRGNLKKTWITSLVDETLAIVHCSSELGKFISGISTHLIDAWKDVNGNTSLAVQNNIVSVGFAVIVLVNKLNTVDPKLLTQFSEAQVIKKSLKNEKASFISSYRAFTKITAESDAIWAIRALKASIKELVAIDDDAVSKDWALAWIYYIVAPVSFKAKLFVISSLKDIDSSYQPFLRALFTKSIQDLLNRPKEEPKSTDNNNLAYIPFTKFTGVITALFSVKDTVGSSLSEKDFVPLLIIAHHPEVFAKGGWVNLCLESGIDPGSVVEKYSNELLDNIFTIADLSIRTDNESMLHAAFSSAATLSFINSSLVTPKLVKYFVEKLDVSKFSDIGDETITIWNTPEGQVAFDPFAVSKKYVESKNTKNKEKEWEDNLRKEIAAKKGLSQKPKYTKEEQAKVNEQIYKESQIRSTLREFYYSVRKALVLISNLSSFATTADNGVDIWFPEAVESLLSFFSAGLASTIFKGEASRVYIKLSSNITGEITKFKDMLLVSGVASLRALKVTDIDSQALLRPGSLGHYVTETLYSLKFLRNPLGTNALVYFLPLLMTTLESKNGIDVTDDDNAEEQVLLDLEILSNNAEGFQSEKSPRKRLLRTLLKRLDSTNSNIKVLKDTLNRILQSISDNLSIDELDLLVKEATSSDASVRSIVLELIDNELDLTHLDYSSEIWIERFENEKHNAEMADSIWTENELSLDETSPFKLISFLDTPHVFLRSATSKAIAAAISEYPQLLSQLFEDLSDLFKEKSKPPVAVKDKFGMEVNPGSKGDTWEVRSGIALTLKEISPLLSNDLIEKFFQFIINGEALGDKNIQVREQVQDAGRSVIQSHGIVIVETLIPIFDDYLSKDLKKSDTHDRIRESVVILYGALACHLEASDPRVIKVVDRLISTLDTPNEDVQYAASECLAPLVKLFEPKLGHYIKILQDKLFNDGKYAHRRGAAYGIAGLVKGSGIVALTDYDLIRILIDAVEDRKDPKKRQGAQFAFECLSQSLQSLFEPYVFEIIPLILSSLGDSAPEVREATSYAARQIMKHATGYGIKKLVPLTLESLDQTAWRAKKGAVDLLGIMAYLDPRQLSASLSTIIPELVGVLNDSHKEVRISANQSLKRFGEVIKNPEIQSLVPVLIRAISDPTQHTEEALNGLLKTQFVHYIDAPSLALVIHILHRGLKDRSANIKRKAAQIVGNMAILTDSNDLIPYLPSLISELEISMVDPVPATRSTASRSIGALVEKLGEDQFPDLIPRLMSTLKAKDKIGDRLGSAQGLAEIIYGLGVRKLEELLPIILKNCTSSQSHVREGFMPLLIYLPGAFSASFSPYLTQIIPPILSGLADDTESIRETSLKAGRLVIKNFATKAVDLLLPELESGLSDYSYRIRAASVELTGDLLFQLAGVSGNVELGEEDRIIYGDVSKTIVEALGTKRRDIIFSNLFICRTDTYPQVRGIALEVWKSLVFNTPRMIKEILPTLTMVIINRLASTNTDQRTIAAQSLGELVRRVGGTALSRLLPNLSEGMKTSDVDARQGICIAVTELIGSTQVDDLEAQQTLFINIIRDGLGDSNEMVRNAAARAFDVLQNAIGNQVIDNILPDLIKLLQSEETSENALAALQQIISTKGAIVFPILIPTLLAPPMTISNARSLGALASFAGRTLVKRFSFIVNTLYDALVEAKNETAKSVFSSALDSVLLSIDFDDGAHTLMQHMLALARNPEPERRGITFDHMNRFFSESDLDYSDYLQDWVSLCIASLDDVDPSVVKSAWTCLGTIIKVQSQDVVESLVKPAREALRTTGSPGQDLPGFALPKGPSCILPIFLQGLMNGTSDQREVAALGIADIVERTSAANLKVFVTQITGPLIRIVGERVPTSVKAAILHTLNILLVKMPLFLRPFLPQLQRTFAKALTTPDDETLRARAGKALATLVKLQPKVDPLVTELVRAARQEPVDEDVVASIIKALSNIFVVAGNKVDSAKALTADFIDEKLVGASESNVRSLATLFGSLAQSLDSEELEQTVTSNVFNNPNERFAVLSLNALLRYAGKNISKAEISHQIAEYLISHINANDDEISENSIRATGKYLLETYSVDKDAADDGNAEKALNFDHSPEVMSQIVQELATAMGKSTSRSVETRRLALVVVRTVSRRKYDLICKQEYLDILVPAIFACVRDSIIPVKLAAEKAYLQVFKLTENLLEQYDTTGENGTPSEVATKDYDTWYKHAVDDVVLAGTASRSVSEFTRRVALKLAAAEVDRIQGGGDIKEVYSDRIEDDEDIWAIGAVQLAVEEDV